MTSDAGSPSQDEPTLEALLDVATEAATRAGQIALEGFRTALDIRSKGGTDIVTEYDHAAEETAIAIIQGRYPAHAFLAEESGETLGQVTAGAKAGQGYVWMIDPIDGTHNYAYQLPFWCVSVAVADAATHQILAGAIYDPLHGELFAATRGGGATVNGTALSVSDTRDVEKAIVAYDIGHSQGIAERMVGLIGWLQPRVAKVRHLGSAALSLTYVAAGRIDAYYHLSLQPWDVAAALLLIQEAGGVVTDWEGQVRLSGSGAAVAAGKSLHPNLLAMLREGEHG